MTRVLVYHDSELRKGRAGTTAAPIHVHIVAAEVECNKELEQQREIRVGRGKEAEQTRCRASAISSSVSCGAVRDRYELTCP